MKLFQNVRSNFEKMGIDSYQTNQVQSFNVKVALILLCLVIMFISTTTVVVLKATAIFEYAICFYFNATRSTVMAMWVFNFEIGMRHDSTSSIIIYNKVVKKIERFSELANYLLMKITLFVVTVPTIIATYFKYYVLRLGDASFQEFPFV